MDKQEEKEGEGGPRGVEKVGWGGRAGILSQLVDKAEGMLINTSIFSNYLGFRYTNFNIHSLFIHKLQALLKRTTSLNCYRILYNNVIKFDSL